MKRISLAVLSFCLCAPAFAAPKIGVLLKAKSGYSGYWAAVEAGALEGGKQAGADVVVKAPPAESDIGIQIQLLNAMAAQGMDAIVIAPINKEALAVPIASAAVKGIKIVIIDTPITGNAAAAFVGTDHTAAGRAAGELLAKFVSDTDEVAILRHSQASGATADRESAAISAFHAVHPSAAIHADIYASAQAGEEMEKAKLLVAKYPNVKAVLATGTAGSLALLKVIDDEQLAGKFKFIGFGYNLNADVAHALESGKMTAWIAQLPKEIGAKGVAAAVSLLKGEKVPAVIHTNVVTVTAENLKDPSVQALLSL